MNKCFRVSVILWSLVSILGCGDSSSGGSSNAPLENVHQASDNEPLDVFFSAFMYRERILCEYKEVVYHNMGVENILIGKNALGQDILASSRIDVFPDFTFRASYEEIDVLEYTSNGYASKTSGAKEVRGRWQINGRHIEFENFGIARRNFVPGMRILFFTYSNNIINEGLKENETNAVPMSSRKAIESVETVCPK